MELPEFFTQFVRLTILKQFRESAKHAWDKDKDNPINQTALAVALLGLAQFETDPESKHRMLEDADLKLADFYDHHPDARFYTSIVTMAASFVNLGSINGTIFSFSFTMSFLLQAIYMEPTNELYTKSVFSIVQIQKKYMEFFTPSTSEHTSSDSHSDSEDPTIELFSSIRSTEIHDILEMHKYSIEHYQAATTERTSSNSKDLPTYPPFLATMLEIQNSYIEFVNKLATSEQTKSDSELDESFEKIRVQYNDFIHELIFEDARLKSAGPDNLTKFGGALLGLSMMTQEAEKQKSLITVAIKRLEEAAGLETNRDKEETLCYLSIAYTVLACRTSDIAKTKLYFRLAEDHIKKAIAKFTRGDFYSELYSNSSVATKMIKKMYYCQETTGGVSRAYLDAQGYKRMEKRKISDVEQFESIK